MLSQEVNDFERGTSQYFLDVSNLKSLSKKQERELVLQYRQGNEEARQTILKSNLKFVITIAKAYKGRGVPFADLIGEGNLGLVKAFDKFDLTQNTKFISYAVWWIKQSILEAIEKRGGLLAEELPQTSPSKNIEEDEDFLESETENVYIVEDEDTFSKENVEDSKKILNSLLDILNEREINILIAYYGLDGSEPQTLEEIGASYNLTKERVRQINEKSLKKMRSYALVSKIRTNY